VFLNNINNEELKVFYSKSIALLFPSLYEGFGIPVLEAMASKTLVITSNISSLPEVGGEYAFYVDPYKINSIIEKLKKVINLDNKTREDLLEKQLNYISNKFSLEKMQKYFKELV